MCRGVRDQERSLRSSFSCCKEKAEEPPMALIIQFVNFHWEHLFYVGEMFYVFTLKWWRKKWVIDTFHFPAAEIQVCT